MNNSSPQTSQPALNNQAESIPDFAITYHGTVSLFYPLTDKANDWLRLYCPPDGEHQYFAQALAIEHRYVCDILELAIRDGLTPPLREKRAV